MNRTDALLLDASVWVASVDPDDRNFAAAQRLVLDFDRSVSALDLTLYEIANVLGPRRGRPEVARQLFRLMPSRCEALLEVDPDLLAAALRLCEEHGLTAYDAAYVAAARSRGWTLVSVDEADLVSRGLAVLPADA